MNKQFNKLCKITDQNWNEYAVVKTIEMYMNNMFNKMC